MSVACAGFKGSWVGWLACRDGPRMPPAKMAAAPSLTSAAPANANVLD